MVTSMRMLGIEMAKRNFWLSTLHDASMVLSQKPRVGMHCNRVRRNCRRDGVLDDGSGSNADVTRETSEGIDTCVNIPRRFPTSEPSGP